MIILIEPNKNGKIELTKEQLQEYLEQAKEEGAREERNHNIDRITLNPCKSNNPNGTGTPPLDWNKVTCASANGESEIIALSKTQGLPTIKK